MALAGLGSLLLILVGSVSAAPPQVILGFVSPVGGSIADADGEGTGFTGVLTNTAGNQYVPASINRTGSELRITSSAGDINANTQQNALFTTFDGTDDYSVGATLVGPLGLTAGSQSAGIFVGPDQQNNIKLVAGRSAGGVYRVQLAREAGGTVTTQNVTLPAVQTATRIDLTLEVNPDTDAVTGRYSIDGGAPGALGSTLPGIGTAADKAGVITTNAGTTQTITARYDSFVVEPGSSALFQARRIIIEDGDAPSWHLPTSLEIGPDGRLWVSGMNGRIYIFNLDEDYNATVQRVETSIFNRPNFQFDGVTPAPGVQGRMVTGITFGPESTPSQQVLYVTHSDPQIYIKNIQPGESPIDPASGTITRMVFNSSAQLVASQDLVTHLPRSSENHGLAGLAFGPDGWLYVSVGSNTNFGEQSLFFGYFPEVPLSASVIRINPMAMGAQTPTDAADDETIDATVGSRFSWVDPCNVAAGESVGNGCSAAYTLAGSANNNGTVPGKFEIYATGFRNLYDLMWHSNGKFYANDNEGNSGFGLASVGPGVGGSCTGTPYDPADAGDPPDELFLVQAGAYHGFPNPTRNECNWSGGVQPITTYHVHSSTNGIAEYTADTFGGLLKGQILSVNYAIGDSIDRVRLSPDGNSVIDKQTFGTGFTDPLDVIVDDAGTLIVAEHGGFPGKISVVEPVPGAAPSCAPLGPSTDTDGDGYTDRDEIDNGTSRCSPSSSPPDFDDDGASDLNDADDDNDGAPDASDPLQYDASNGANTVLPFSLLFNNSNLGGFFGTGFHGVQPSSNGGGPVVGLVGAGGAGGYMQVVAQAGTMQGSANNAVNALQEGFDATDPFTASLFVGEPFQDGNPQSGEAGGVYFGPSEDDYVHLAVHANNGNPIIELGTEVNGTFTRSAASPSLPLPQSFVKLYLDGDPGADTVTARYQLGNNPIQTIGTVAVPGAWFGSPGLAGVYTTRAGSNNAQRTFIFDDFVIESSTPGSDTTPPSLSTRTPAVNATGVAAGTNVTATFDEALAPASVTTTSVTLAPTAGGPAIPAAVTLGSGNTQITLNPSADLAAGTQYTATLSTTIEDVAGNNLTAPITWSFTTAAASGGTGAYLPSGGQVTIEAEGFSANTPRDGDAWGAAGAPAGFVGTALTLGPDNGSGWDNTELASAPQLDIPVNFPSAGTWHVWVRAYNPNTAGNSLHIGLDGAGQAASVDLSNSTFGSWLWFRTRTSGLTARVEVPSAGVHTLNVFGREDGIHLDRLVLTTNASFTPTGTGPAESPREGGPPPGDTTPPALSTRTPAPNATGVAVASNVTATFDEALAPASVTTTSVTLAPTAGGANIPAAVTLGSGNTVITLNPSADLAASTAYTATLSTTIEDVAGNNLAAPITWSFTTTAASGGGAFIPSAGQVVMEAESFTTNTPRGTDAWTSVTTPAGAVGTAMASGPDNGSGAGTPITTTAPELTYQVDFPSAGTWHVWVRGHNPDGAGNSVHVGLDGATQAASVDLTSNTLGSYTWFRSRVASPTARIEVPSAGVHTVNVYMREDGFVLDRLLLTTNATSTPTGTGPAESPRG